MAGDLKTFGQATISLTRSPLGIIALFIVMVYGFASILTAFTSTLSGYERMPLICFLVVFPVLVLGVFTWLVAYHSDKIYGPADPRTDENYLRMKASAVASLTAASTPTDDHVSHANVEQIVRVVESAAIGAIAGGQHSHCRILWVDPEPLKSTYTRNALQAMGISSIVVRSAMKAPERVSQSNFAAVVAVEVEEPDLRSLRDTLSGGFDPDRPSLFVFTRAMHPSDMFDLVVRATHGRAG